MTFLPLMRHRKQKPWSGSKETNDIDIITTIEYKIKPTVTDEYGLVCFFYYNFSMFDRKWRR